MLVLSFLLNLAILVPVVSGLMLRPDAMQPAFGPDTDARRILICLYITIALASVVGLGLVLAGHASLATQLGVTLFAVQICYKVLTVPMLGLASPVVLTNLFVVVLHCATLASLWISRPA